MIVTVIVVVVLSVTLLKQRDKNASKEWLDKLPQMVKQLEVSLYRSAESFEAYADKSTLKHRLLVLAMEIMAKTEDGGEREEIVAKNRDTRSSVDPTAHTTTTNII